MNMQRIAELRNSLDNENISYAELSEIESAYVEISGNNPADMLAGDMLDIIEDNFTERVQDGLETLLDSFGLEWTVYGLMVRLKDTGALSSLDYPLD